VLKTDLQGQVIWSYAFGGRLNNTGLAYVNALIPTRDGGNVNSPCASCEYQVSLALLPLLAGVLITGPTEGYSAPGFHFVRPTQALRLLMVCSLRTIILPNLTLLGRCSGEFSGLACLRSCIWQV